MISDNILEISDESDNGELPSLDLGSDEDANLDMGLDCKIEPKSPPTSPSGFPSVTKHDFAMNQAEVAKTENMKIKSEWISISTDDDDEDFDMQQAIAISLRSFQFSNMCNMQKPSIGNSQSSPILLTSDSDSDGPCTSVAVSSHSMDMPSTSSMDKEKADLTSVHVGVLPVSVDTYSSTSKSWSQVKKEKETSKSPSVPLSSSPQRSSSPPNSSPCQSPLAKPAAFHSSVPILPWSSAEHSDDESDTLPDLDDYLPDLDPIPSLMEPDRFWPVGVSSLHTLSGTGSPRRKTHRHFLDGLFRPSSPKRARAGRDTPPTLEKMVELEDNTIGSDDESCGIPSPLVDAEDPLDSVVEFFLPKDAISDLTAASVIPEFGRAQIKSETKYSELRSGVSGNIDSVGPVSSSGDEVRRTVDTEKTASKRDGDQLQSSNTQPLRSSSSMLTEQCVSKPLFPSSSSSSSLRKLRRSGAKISKDKARSCVFMSDKHDRPVAVGDLHRRLVRDKCRVSFLKGLLVFPDCVSDCATQEFDGMQAACMDDLTDDFSTDLSHFEHCMDLLQEFAANRRPPQLLLDKVVQSVFFGPVEDETIPERCQLILMRLWQRYPESINLERAHVLAAGDTLQKYLQNSSLSPEAAASSECGSSGTGSSSCGGTPNFSQARLYFQMFLEGLQLNLSRCTLADQQSVNRSLAFALLSADISTSVVKQISHWIDFCLVVRDKDKVSLAREWLWELQTLVSVSILVSRDRMEAAKKLASELRRTYKYLSDLWVKRHLLQSLQCPLLTFCMLRLVMEDQCGSVILSSQFPSSLSEVAHNYFAALPPHDHMTTPPPSPSEGEVGGVHVGPEMCYSPQACEELAMLVYFITKSYLACKQRRLHGDLRSQVLKAPSVPTLTEEERSEFSQAVKEFAAHLDNLSTELTSSTRTYSNLLECLGRIA